MVRATNLFAAASATLLILGLILSNFFPTRGMSVWWPGSSMGRIIGFQIPCYGLAGLFAIFAFSYALRWIRVNEAIVDWHLWLSLSGVAMFGLGFALLARVAGEGAAPHPGQATLLVIAGGMLLDPATFAGGQLLLMIGLLARFAAQHH
jgi:hypothetical protein